jgi:hypothetical protein
MACLLAVILLLGSAAVAIRRRWMPSASGPPAWLADSVVGLALLIAELELLGAVGLFALGPIVLGAIVISVAVHLATPARNGRGTGAGTDSRPRLAPAFLLAGLAGAVVLAEWAGPTFHSYDVGIRSFDSLWYHLPWAATYAQTGWTTPLHFTDVEYLTPFYPATAEMLHGLGIVLLGRDTLSPALNLGWLGLVLLAAYCVGRRAGVGPATLLGAALACATPMMTGSQAGTAANDAAGVFFLIAAVALIPAWRAEPESGDEDRFALGLGGVAAGLALAVKLTLLAPVAALSAGVIWLGSGRAVRRREIAVRWLVPVALAGGYWYVRNLVAVGNPLPWVAIPGLAVPAAPLQQHTSFSIAHYLTDTHLLGTTFARGLAGGFGAWWPAVLVAAVAGPVLCVLPGASRRTRMLGLVALASIAAYLVTPESAAGPAGRPLGFAFNLRYSAPALVLSLSILPLAPALNGRRARAAVPVLLAALLVLTVSRTGLWPSRHLAAAIALGAVALGAAVALARRGQGRLTRRPVLLVSAGALALLIAGYPWQRHYLRGRYAFAPGVSSLARVWAFFRPVRDARVGVVGTFGGFFAYPLFGLDASNRVRYVAAGGPHGSFTPIATCRAWRRAVNRGGFRYVVTTPARDPWRPRALLPSPEARWTMGDPAAHPVLSYRAHGRPVVVFALTGRLTPSGCPPG